MSVLHSRIRITSLGRRRRYRCIAISVVIFDNQRYQTVKRAQDRQFAFARDPKEPVPGGMYYSFHLRQNSETQNGPCQGEKETLACSIIIMHCSPVQARMIRREWFDPGPHIVVGSLNSGPNLIKDGSTVVTSTAPLFDILGPDSRRLTYAQHELPCALRPKLYKAVYCMITQLKHEG
jgi:hypothetical protein